MTKSLASNVKTSGLNQFGHLYNFKTDLDVLKGLFSHFHVVPNLFFFLKKTKQTKKHLICWTRRYFEKCQLYGQKHDSEYLLVFHRRKKAIKVWFWVTYPFKCDIFGSQIFKMTDCIKKQLFAEKASDHKTLTVSSTEILCVGKWCRVTAEWRVLEN